MSSDKKPIYQDKRTRKTPRRVSQKNSDCREYLLKQTEYERDTVENKDIAERFGVSIKIVSKTRINNKIKLGMSKEIKEALDDVPMMVLADMTNREVSEDTGFTASAISAYRVRRKKAEGYPARGKPKKSQIKDRWVL